MSRAGARPRPKVPPKPPRRLDLQHMLSAVVGAYVGLVFYSLITPGQIPHEPPVPTPDPRMSLRMRELAGQPGADGLFHVSGKLHNERDRVCRFANVTVRFLDSGDKEVTQTLATVESIPAHGEKPFEVRALATGAVRFESTVDLAQF